MDAAPVGRVTAVEVFAITTNAGLHLASLVAVVAAMLLLDRRTTAPEPTNRAERKAEAVGPRRAVGIGRMEP